MLSFNIDDAFIDDYAQLPTPWGYPAGPGLTVGELVYLRTYSAQKEDGSKERWHETARRVVEGAFSIQKDHVQQVINAVWDEDKAQRSAREMYRRLHDFKFWVPGRGLENMGTEGVNGWGYADRLFNCAFVSTGDTLNPTRPFASLMSKSMRGVGVGFDTAGRGILNIHKPKGVFPYRIPDSTEGWVDSTEALLKSYFHGRAKPIFDYSGIRPKGSPIHSGGKAPGAQPLRELHMYLDYVLGHRITGILDSRTIVDVANLIGKAVVAGGKRRTALLALGYRNDPEFSNLKNPDLPENAQRLGKEPLLIDNSFYKNTGGWGWSSNNSIKTVSQMNIDFEAYAEQQIYMEPGIFVEDLVQNYGRMQDGYGHIKDKATGTNPCGEISLEDGETCNLVTINLMNHDGIKDFLTTIKYAYLYAKSVTLMPTSWPDTNTVSMRNRRIGCSVSGVAEFVEKYGWGLLRKWLDKGYDEIRKWDHMYSEWLCVRESIKVTTVKPEGTAALLSGSTPGVHYPVEQDYIRRVQFDAGDPLLEVLDDAGYHIEPYKGNPESTLVCEIPVRGHEMRTQHQVSVYEKMALATMMQDVWSDNQVSFTLTFDREHMHDLAAALKMNWGKYKSLSCAPLYKVEDAEQAQDMQLPYQSISRDQYIDMASRKLPPDLDKVYNNGMEALGDKYCDSDRCVI